MMGQPPPQVPKPCYYGLCLEERIPPDHLLRKIRTQVDFDFTYDLVRPYYGVKGNVSVPPPVRLKMMLLLFLYDVPSERDQEVLSAQEPRHGQYDRSGCRDCAEGCSGPPGAV
jgi:transposase